MIKEITQLKIRFLAAQTGILVFAFIVMSLILGIYNVKHTVREANDRLDKTMALLTDQLKSNQLPSSTAVSAYDFAVSIIDSESGNLLVDRKSPIADDRAESLWQSYKAKLVYQMQKQKQGAVLYPEQSPWQWWDKKHLVRFSTVPELGWIVALEYTMDPDMAVFAKTYTASNILLFLIIATACGFSFWWFLTNNFTSISKTIADTVEKDMLSLAGENVWDGVKSETPAKAPVVEPAPSADFFQDDARVAPKSIVTKPSSLPERPPVEHLQEKKSTAPPAVEPRPAVTRAVTPPEPKRAGTAPKSEDSSQELSINVGHIKSELLKKMIRELRNN